MKKAKKRLLGCIGLAAVIVMTLIACGISDPAEAAEATTSHTDTIKVLVHEHSTVSFANPALTDPLYATVNTKVPVGADFTDANNISYYLSWQGLDQLEPEIELRKWCALTGEIITEEKPCPTFGVISEGTDNFVVDLKKLIDSDGDEILDDGFGYGEYTIRAVLSDGGADSDEDITRFIYSPVTSKVTPDDNGNPVLEIETDDQVDKVLVEIKDENGNIAYGPIEVDVRQCVQGATCKYNPETGGWTITFEPFPFVNDKKPIGEYSFTVSGYNNEKGLLYRPMVTKYKYAVAPYTPNTGSILTQLNISRVDYLVTGLIVFGAVAGFGIYLIARNKRRR